ncbi:MAG: NAD-dependent epimerase/dehydratase family protein [Candidatus Omnitrophica bacterium]|nr:NAD-dependent epimerase/dehydratase family protein [Candidatus Omnitrophota bacterium]MCM8809141.1 NAD-dependent epimerase/dehydratase family protein [Candidatus Omnitrophota bacterium]MCM8811117.1 NAD-dependent epimerase/dehydratase family protein [Candidatus Omnitrophota bacterium]MCM8833269.1 NAD-dependent epimerase/dehydratase family protein [Candidatus Omnitrophota bacterium]
MGKVLVTGGCGFIGSHTVDKLIEENYQVIVIDNLSTGFITNLNKKAIFYNIDIRDKERLKEIFENNYFDYIFHFAAQINVRKGEEEPFFDVDVNIGGIINLLEIIKKNPPKKIIFSSTGGVIYGLTDILPTPETVEPFPICIYGISKLTCEKLLYAYWKKYGINYVALRYGNVYGPRQNYLSEAGVIAIFISRILSGKECIIFGDGNQTRDFIYIEDVISANIAFMNNDITGIFNVGTGIETSVNRIFEIIREKIGKDCKKVYGEEKKGELKRSCLSIEKIKKQINWLPKFSIEEGIEKTVDWFCLNFRI